MSSGMPYQSPDMKFWNKVGSHSSRIERNIIKTDSGRFRVRAHKGKRGGLYVGTFDTIEEARKARDENDKQRNS